MHLGNGGGPGQGSPQPGQGLSGDADAHQTLGPDAPAVSGEDDSPQSHELEEQVPPHRMLLRKRPAPADTTKGPQGSTKKAKMSKSTRPTQKKSSGREELNKPQAKQSQPSGSQAHVDESMDSDQEAENVPRYLRDQPGVLSHADQVELRNMERPLQWLKKVGKEYQSPKTKQAFSTKLLIHRPPNQNDNEQSDKEFFSLNCQVPQVKEQQHDFTLFKTAHDLAIANQESLPPHCHPALHLTAQSAASLGRERLADLFQQHSLVIEPDPSSSHLPSPYETEDGRLTLQNIIDESMVVEVH
ncbi:hypothetical protein FRC06_001163, partial [Ceratobasidium sp. 370]